MFKLLVILSVAYHCHAYSAGAPTAVCDDMTPKHPADPQTSELPYRITVSKSQVKPGETIEIGISGEDFKGLLIEVRKGDKAVGEFVVSDSDRYFKAITCHGNTNSAVTHKNASIKNNQKLTWKAPNETGDLVVYVTVAKDGDVFWAHRETAKISVA